jgi:hypothetical protein
VILPCKFLLQRLDDITGSLLWKSYEADTDRLSTTYTIY